MIAKRWNGPGSRRRDAGRPKTTRIAWTWSGLGGQSSTSLSSWRRQLAGYATGESHDAELAGHVGRDPAEPACQGPPATVRTRLFRARALLREALARDLDAATAEVFGFAGERCPSLTPSAERFRALAASNPRRDSQTYGECPKTTGNRRNDP